MRTLVALSLCVVCSVAVFGSPQNQASGQTTFKSSVDLIQLDVSVLDKDRRPVRGLKQSDFTVLENDQPRTIQALATIDLPDATSTAAATTWLRDVTPDVTTNAVPQTGRIFIIVLDDALMPMDLGAIEMARKGAAGFVSQMGPQDLAAVVFTMLGRGAQGLTNDRTKLLTAVNSLSRMGKTSLGVCLSAPPGIPPPYCPFPKLAPTCSDYISSIRVVEDASDYLAALPGRRKSIIYFSGGMGIDLPKEAISGPLFGGDKAGREGCGSQVAGALREVFTNAQRANVNVYGVDPMGLRTDGYLDSPSGQVVQYLQVISDNTGGHAIVNTNDLAPGLSQIFRENSSYYLLGYLPVDTKADGSIRRITVKVDRPGVEVVSRRMYYAPKAPKANAVPPPANVTALSEILPDSRWPMRIALAPFATDTAGVLTMALGLERHAPHDRLTDNVEITVKAFTPEGDARGSVEESVPVVLPPSATTESETRFDVLAQLPVKPGRYQLRVSAHAKELDTRGSVYADVDVPDFAKAPVSLSGVLVTVAPTATAAPRFALNAFVPVIPTTERTFARTTHVSAFLRVYEGAHDAASPVTVFVETIDAQQQTVATQRIPIGPDPFAARHQADLTYAVPVAKLEPGDYALQFEATLGKTTAVRDVRFSVK